MKDGLVIWDERDPTGTVRHVRRDGDTGPRILPEGILSPSTRGCVLPALADVMREIGTVEAKHYVIALSPGEMPLRDLAGKLLRPALADAYPLSIYSYCPRRDAFRFEIERAARLALLASADR